MSLRLLVLLLPKFASQGQKIEPDPLEDILVTLSIRVQVSALDIKDSDSKQRKGLVLNLRHRKKDSDLSPK